MKWTKAEIARSMATVRRVTRFVALRDAYLRARRVWQAMTPAWTAEWLERRARFNDLATALGRRQEHMHRGGYRRSVI